jgi:hypothetical protein
VSGDWEGEVREGKRGLGCSGIGRREGVLWLRGVERGGEIEGGCLRRWGLLLRLLHTRRLGLEPESGGEFGKGGDSSLACARRCHTRRTQHQMGFVVELDEGLGV